VNFTVGTPVQSNLGTGTITKILEDDTFWECIVKYQRRGEIKHRFSELYPPTEP
jgi:hypothetical protein